MSIFAIDFDGTVVTHDYPKVGRDIGAVPVLRALVASGHQIILWTMRSGHELQEAVNWFYKNQIPLFGVNENPEQGSWTKSPKAYCHTYIDDLALGAPLVRPTSGERPYIDWTEVAKLLKDL